MRSSSLLALALVAVGCSQPTTMTTPEIPSSAMSASVSTDPRPTQPGFDLDAAEIIGSGKFETATFALGWFWGPDSQFGGLDGVLRTRVGYAGGTTASPTYHSIGNHSEAIEIDFDPGVLSYAELARIFFAAHNPCSDPWSTQYRSAAFPRSAEQRRVLEETAKTVEDRTGKLVQTAIEDYTGFTLAEDYHQKYRLRRIKSASAEFEAMFPTTEAFIGSVAVTKANAYVGGYGTTEDLRSDDPSKGKLGQLGLSEAATASILKAAR